MEKDWTKIATYSNAIQGEISRQMLEENNIPAVIMNKQDSSYLFGKIELYVSQADALQAQELINNQAENSDNNTPDED